MKKNELVKLYAAYKSGCLGNNILDTYFTFFANIILEENVETISEEEMQKCFEKKYRVELPLGFVRQVLGMGISNGAIIDERGAYLPKRDVLLKYKFEKSDFEKFWKELISEFKEFCNKKDIEVDERHIEEKIIFAIDNTDEIILSNDKLDEEESVNGFEYAWYSFVREEANSNEEMFDFITALCASNITGQAIFYSGKEGENYSGLNVYLDSPMIFALLGMDSNERESSYKLLVKNMKKMNCNVMVLDHNYCEVEGIITRAAGWALSTGYDIRKANNAARFFHDSQMTREEITEFCGQIETKLNLLGIVKKDTDYDMHSDKFQESETDLYEMIKKKYIDQKLAILPEKEESIKVDVRSIVMIYRERQGCVSVHVNEAKHIMLTTNNAIANVCKKYESNKSINSGHIPACISADLFGAILWLSSPNEMMNYQRKKVLADCYDFLQPNKIMIDKYIESLENARKLGEIDEKKFLFMRTHPIVLDTLMDITRGDYARFNDRTYLEVYDTIVAQSEKKYEVEAEAHLSTKEELETERNKSKKLENKVEELEKKENAREQKRKERIDIISKRRGKILSIVLLGIPYIIFIALGEITKGYFSSLTMRSVIAVAGIIILSVIAGKLYHKLQNKLIKMIYEYLEKNII